MPKYKNPLAQDFVSNKNGSVAIIIGVMVFALIAILMMTVDLSRVQNGKTNNQSAIDAAVLGAAEYVTRYRVINKSKDEPQDYEKYAKSILVQNLSRDQSDATVETKDENGNKIDNFRAIVGGSITTEDGQVLTASKSEVLVYTCLVVNTEFAAILNNGKTKKVCNYAKASLPGLNNVEIVFALDISTSMTLPYKTADGKDSTKLQALKDAMTAIFDKYSDNTSLYWGIVPYSGYVNLGMMYPNIVLNDFSDAQPADEIQPAQGKYRNEPLKTYKYKYNVVEDSVADNFVRIFNFGIDPGDGNYPDHTALDVLIQVPLTTRGDGRIDLTDNSPPVVGNSSTMFQAYWHHPYDFFMEFVQHDGSSYNNEAAGLKCGECFQIKSGWETQVGGDQCAGTYDNPCDYSLDDPDRPSYCNSPNPDTGSRGER